MKWSKLLWTGLGVAAGLALVACLTGIGIWIYKSQVPDVSSYHQEGVLLDEPENEPVEEAGPEQAPVEEVQPEGSEAEFQSPIDFGALKEQNQDIYAWLSLPGTEIDYPVVQRQGDDAYYLDRDIYGKPSTAGSLFTESYYNGTDMTDPVTMIYGHNMKNGTMFGQLRREVSAMSLDDQAVFYIYLPDKTLTYQIFAAVPYSDAHLLYYYDFGDQRDFEDFFESIRETKSVYGTMNPEGFPEFGQQVVILSTCFRTDPYQRFLVMGALVQEEP